METPVELRRQNELALRQALLPPQLAVSPSPRAEPLPPPSLAVPRPLC